MATPQSASFAVSERQYIKKPESALKKAKQGPVVIDDSDVVMLSLKGFSEQEKEAFLSARSPSKLERKVRKFLHSFLF